MRKSIFAFAALAAMLCSACNNEISPAAEGEGSITVKVEGVSGTRASDVTPLAAETAVKKVEVLVFGTDGKLVTYKDLGTSLSGTTDKITKATYTVYAVVNGASLGLSSCNTEADFKAKAVKLTEYNNTTNGFAMCGSSTCSVIEDNTACAITASRFASRIVLKSIENAAPAAKGAITVKAVFLSNVNTKNTLDGTGAATAVASDFVNQFGRTEWVFTSMIHAANAPAAAVAALTYKAETTTVANGNTVNFGINKFAGYCYANSNTNINLAADATALPASYTPTTTRLVVLATFDGADYYYPVIVPNVARNTSYDIVLKITDKGLEDPQGDPTVLSEKGSIKATVTIAPWNAGTEISADY